MLCGEFFRQCFPFGVDIEVVLICLGSGPTVLLICFDYKLDFGIFAYCFNSNSKSIEFDACI